MARLPWPRTTWSLNITKEDIRVRMSAIDEAAWPSPAIKEKIPPTVENIPLTEFTLSGVDPMTEVVRPIYQEINELYDLDLKPEYE